MHARADVDTVSFSFSPRPENVALARMVAGAVAARHGLPAATVDDVRLLVSEACTNAVRAHLRCRLDEAVSLTCRVDGTFCVEVSDHGCGDEVVADGAFPEPGTASGGYGIPIMMHVASAATFERNATGGTTVRLAVPTDCDAA